MTAGTLFTSPTSVFVCGSNRSLLNWVAYALASSSDPEFHWTDVRLASEVRAPDDVLSRGLIPDAQLSFVAPRELAPDNAAANVVVSGVVRADETPEDLQRIMEFLRLPSQTQQVISRRASGRTPPVVVLSNGHRLVALYTDIDEVRPTVRAILSAGVTLIMTFADAPPGGRLAFDVVLHVGGEGTKGWREARLFVERAPTASAFRSGLDVPLSEFDPVASVLGRALG